jgi:hypothetical protein
MFRTKVVEKIKKHFLCSVTLFFENRAVYEIMWGKYGRAGQATMWKNTAQPDKPHDNMAHEHCMVDN